MQSGLWTVHGRCWDEYSWQRPSRAARALIANWDTVPRHRWTQFVDDCKNFLSPSENWAERAARLGWHAMALFGCAPKRPLDYLGSAGLVWAINGGRLLELHRDWAVIDIPVHGSQRIFYRRNVDAAKISLPWARRD